MLKYMKQTSTISHHLTLYPRLYRQDFRWVARLELYILRYRPLTRKDTDKTNDRALYHEVSGILQSPQQSIMRHETTFAGRYHALRDDGIHELNGKIIMLYY